MRIPVSINRYGTWACSVTWTARRLPEPQVAGSNPVMPVNANAEAKSSILLGPTKMNPRALRVRFRSMGMTGSSENSGSGCVSDMLPHPSRNAGKIRVRGEFSEFHRKPEKQGSGLDFQDFEEQAKQFSNSASKCQLESVRAILAKAHARRFKQRKEPRYGSINKGASGPWHSVLLEMRRRNILPSIWELGLHGP